MVDEARAVEQHVDGAGLLDRLDVTPSSVVTPLMFEHKLMDRARAAGKHIVLPEAAWYHAPSLERHASAYSPGIRTRLEMGRYVLGEDYVRAMRLRELLKQHVDRALDRCSALLLPTLPMGAPRLGSATVEFGDRSEPVRAAMLRLTQLFNITGHPALAMPAGLGRDNLPRSVQLVCSRTSQLLAIARDVEPYISGGAGSVGGGTG